MGPILACPAANVLENLSRGLLPPEEMEALLQHVEACERCQSAMQSTPRADTLMDAVGQAGTVPDDPDEGLIAGLVERVKALAKEPMLAAPPRGQDDEATLAPVASRISFSCSHCGKALKAKAELAGKKVKCPGCGKAAQVPGDVPHSPANDRTLPPGELVSSAGKARNSEQTDAGAPSDSADVWDFLAPPQAPDEIGRLGPYRILQVLGQGGMGVVFRAEDPQLERPVALKAMLPSLAASPSAKKRFLREAKAAAAIKHDHIVAIYQVGEDRGAPYLAMEFLEGESLDDRLKREKTLPLAEVLRIGRQMAEGLAAAHERDLVHRDIKPANVWLEGKKERVKILDFGLARSTADTAGLTQQGAIIGTPSYMAPEQANGQNVDHRCDLFSLGCVLYRMTTGELPFRGNDTMSILTSLLLETPKSSRELAPGLPLELSELIDRLLAKDPKNRPASARAVERDLAALERTLADTLHGSAPLRRRVPTPPKRRRLALVACGLLGLAALVFGVVFFLPAGDGTGTIRVAINDPDIEVVVNKDSLTFRGADKQEIRVTPGQQKLKVIRGEMAFETDGFDIKRGDIVRLSVTVLDGKLQVARDGKVIAEKEVPQPSAKLAWKPTPEQQAFIEGIALLPEEKRADTVRRKLIEESGNCNGPRQNHEPSVSFEPKHGPPTKLVYSRGYAVDSIWPIAAIPSLKIVEISALIYDYGPLSGLPLTDVKLRLILDDTTNEAYLKGIKTLKTINGRPVADFWVARDRVRKNIEAMKGKGPTLPVEARKQWLLEQLSILCPEVKEGDFFYDGKSFSSKPIIQDVTPLRGVSVLNIHWEGSGPLSDLRQLSETGLQGISCGHACDVRELSGLKGLPLKRLSIHGSMVADLSPLAGMKLESFECVPRNDNHNGPFLLADLSPLKGMPLKKLNVMGSKVVDLSPLAGMPLEDLDVSYTPVKDLTPLKGLKLTSINLTRTGLVDLSPLAGMPLSTLVIAESQAKDLSPLKGMKLKLLNISKMRMPDLSPLRDMEVEDLQGLDFRLYFEPDEKLIRGPGLKRINGQSPDDFLKGIEKRRKEDADLIAKTAKVKVEAEALKAALDSPLGGAGTLWTKIEEGKVVEIGIRNAHLHHRNYAPLIAFPALRKATLLVNGGEFSPLLKLPKLEELECPPEAILDNLPVLRALPKLKTINGKPAADYWKAADAKAGKP